MNAPTHQPPKSPEETQKELLAEFRKRTRSNSDYLLQIIASGHSELVHIGLTPEETLDRALTKVSRKQRKFSASTFDTQQNCIGHVSKVLSRNAKNIITWLHQFPSFRQHEP